MGAQWTLGNHKEHNDITIEYQDIVHIVFPLCTLRYSTIFTRA
jgi:hypothetical protein